MKIRLNYSIAYLINDLRKEGYKIIFEDDDTFFIELNTIEGLVNFLGVINQKTQLPFVLDGDTITIVNDWI